MTVSKVLSEYNCFFYLSGQSVYNPMKEKMSKNLLWKTKLLNFVMQFAIFGIIWSCTVTGIILNLMEHQSMVAQYDLISDSLFITLLISNSLIFIEKRTSATNLQLMHSRFNAIDRVVKRSLGKNVSLQKFKQQNLTKVIFVSVFFGLDLLLAIVMPSNYFKTLVPEEILWLILRIASLQIICYIELGQYFTKCFSDLVFVARDMELSDFERIMTKTTYDQTMVKFQLCRYVYLKLWHINYLFERSFGWSMVSICLQNSLQASYTMYRIFVMVEELGINAGFVGMYILLKHL